MPTARTWLLSLALLPLSLAPAAAQPGAPPALDAQGDPLPPGALARLGTVRLRQPAGVTALAFAPDGSAVAAGGTDRVIRLWDAATGRLRAEFTGHPDPVAALAYTPDGQALLSAGSEGSMSLWDPATGQVLRRFFRLNHYTRGVALAPDGKTVATVGITVQGQAGVALWELATGRLLTDRAPPDVGAEAVAFSPDGKLLALAGRAGVVQLSDAATGRAVRRFHVARDGKVVRLDPDRADAERALPRDVSLGRVAFAQAGKLLVAADRHNLYFFDAETGAGARRLPGDVCSLHAAPDGAAVVWGGSGNDVHLLEAATGRERWQASRGGSAVVLTAAFAPGGKVLATGGGDQCVRLWDPATGKELHEQPGHAGPLLSLALAPDGKTVYTGGFDDTVRIWDAATGRERGRLGEHWGEARQLTLSSDGTLLAGRGGGWTSAGVWDVARPKQLRRSLESGLIALTADGRQFAVEEGGEVQFRDTATGRVLRRLQRSGQPLSGPAAFAPDGTRFAAVWNREILQWDAATGQLLRSRVAGDYPLALAYTPDSKRLAAAGTSPGLMFFDATTGRRVTEPAYASPRHHAIAFSPDGQLLATDDPDHAVSLRDATGERVLQRAWGHRGPLVGLAFSADGKVLASASADGTALVWDVPRLLQGVSRPPAAPVAVAERPTGPRTDAQGAALPEGARARFGSLRWRFQGGITSAAFAPDGKTLAVPVAEGGRAGVRLLEVPGGTERRHLGDAGAYEGVVAFAPRGRVVAYASGYSQAVTLWDADTGAKLHELSTDGFGTPRALAFSPDGSRLAAGGGAYQQGQRYSILVWDVAAGRRVATCAGLETPVSALAFSADGRRLFSSSPTMRSNNLATPGALCCWDAATGRELRRTANESTSVVFAARGNVLAYQGKDNRLSLVDPETGKGIARVGTEAHWFLLSPDGKTLATASRGEEVRLWDVATGQELRRCGRSAGAWLRLLAFAPDGTTLATVSNDDWRPGGSVLRLWDVATGSEIRPFAGHQDNVTASAHAPDSRRIASGARDGSLYLWDAATGRALHALTGHAAAVTALAFAPDGRLLASGDAGGAVHLWDAAGGAAGQPITLQKGGVLALAFSPDGSTLTVCGDAGAVETWHVARRHQVARCEHSAEPLTTAALSPDGSTLAYFRGGRDFTVHDHRIRLCRVPSGKALASLDLQPGPREERNFALIHCWALTFSPDGRLLASSDSLETHGLRVILSNHTVRVWEVATGQQILQATGLSVPVRRLAFAPDGKTLLHGDGQMHGWGHGSEQRLLVRDISAAQDLRLVFGANGREQPYCATTGQVLRPVGGHLGDLTRAHYAPDGKTLVTGGSDGTLLVWDAAALAPVRAPRPAPAAQELEEAWQQLAGSAPAAYRALAVLEAAPDQAVPLLAQRLRPPAAVEPARVARLIAELDDARFEVRQKAFDELSRHGDLVEGALRTASAGRNGLELQRRLQLLLDRLDGPAPPEQLRFARALVVLERAPGGEAGRVLDALAGGAPAARLTQLARAALVRRGK